MKVEMMAAQMAETTAVYLVLMKAKMKVAKMAALTADRSGSNGADCSAAAMGMMLVASSAE